MCMRVYIIFYIIYIFIYLNYIPGLLSQCDPKIFVASYDFQQLSFPRHLLSTSSLVRLSPHARLNILLNNHISIAFGFFTVSSVMVHAPHAYGRMYPMYVMAYLFLDAVEIELLANNHFQENVLLISAFMIRFNIF